MIDRRPRAPHGGVALPDFQPVERKYRHDGWTPERQRGFIAALADTGSVRRAANMVNMTPEGAYYLRRMAGAESFRRAWEAALDFGVQRLKDLAFERALEGDLVPVMSFGKLVGYRRKMNDRLLMFCLRMNARQPDGRRYSQTWFDPAAPRLTGRPSSSPSGDEAVDLAPQGQGMSGGQADRFMSVRSTDGGVSPHGLSTSLTTPAPTEAEQADDQAALIRGFDPVELSLAQIEQLQALLADAAATKRALTEHPALDPAVTHLAPEEGNTLLESGAEEDATGAYHRPDGEAPWTMLDPPGLKELAAIDEAVASVTASQAAARHATLRDLAEEMGVPLPAEFKAARPRRKKVASGRQSELKS